MAMRHYLLFYITILALVIHYALAALYYFLFQLLTFTERGCEFVDSNMEKYSLQRTDTLTIPTGLRLSHWAVRGCWRVLLRMLASVYNTHITFLAQWCTEVLPTQAANAGKLKLLEASGQEGPMPDYCAN